MAKKKAARAKSTGQKAKPSVSAAVKAVLKYQQGGSEKEFQKAFASLEKIEEDLQASAARKRQAAVAEMGQVLAAAAPRMQLAAMQLLAESAYTERPELLEVLRPGLEQDLLALPAAQGVLDTLETNGFPEIAAVVANSQLSLETRLGILDELAVRSNQPLNSAVPPDLEGLSEKHLLEHLEPWVAQGCPVAPWRDFEVPKAELKRLGVELPPDYAKFLADYSPGSCRRDENGLEFQLTSPAGLVQEVDYQGKPSPAVRRLKVRAEMHQEEQGEDHTLDDRDRKYLLSRLANGIVIGSTGDAEEQLLYLDPADKFAVYVLEEPFCTPAKAASSFSAWVKKTEEFDSPWSESGPAVMAIQEQGGYLSWDESHVNWVWLPNKPLTPEILTALRQFRRLPILQYHHAEPGIDKLLQVVGRTLRQLRRLDLRHAPVTDDGLMHLSSLTELRELEMWDGQTTSKGRKRLEKAIPQLKFVLKNPAKR